MDKKLICLHVAYFGVVVEKAQGDSYKISPGNICSVLPELIEPSENVKDRVRGEWTFPKRFGGINHSLIFYVVPGRVVGVTEAVVVTHDDEVFTFVNYRIEKYLGKVKDVLKKHPSLGTLTAEILFKKDIYDVVYFSKKISLEERATSYIDTRERERQVSQILKGKNDGATTE